MAVKLIKHTLRRDSFGAPYRLHSRFHCRRCGSNNVTMLVIPGAVMGGAWVPGMGVSDCHYCAARTANGSKGGK